MTSPQPIAGLKNVEVSFEIPLPYCRLIVPSLPSTCNWAPCQPIRPASVTTKAGTPKRVKTNPWKAPIAAPASKASSTAVTAPYPCLTFSTTMIEAHRPLTDPTDRSISPFECLHGAEALGNAAHRQDRRAHGPHPLPTSGEASGRRPGGRLPLRSL